MEQEAEPRLGWYLPAKHGTHVEAEKAPRALEAVPALQGVQFVMVGLEEALMTTSEKEPAAQAVQEEAPKAYLPGAQHRPAPAGLKLEGQPLQARGQKPLPVAGAALPAGQG